MAVLPIGGKSKPGFAEDLKKVLHDSDAASGDAPAPAPATPKEDIPVSSGEGGSFTFTPDGRRVRVG